MHIFGLVFVLYFLKLSDGKGFCFHLETTDFRVYKHGIRLEHTSKKAEKCKLDIDLFHRNVVILRSFQTLPT